MVLGPLNKKARPNTNPGLATSALFTGVLQSLGDVLLDDAGLLSDV